MAAASAAACTTATSTCRASSRATGSTTGSCRRPSPRPRRRASAATGTPFNNVGLNLYRDGRDSVAPHNDHLYEIVAGHPIALLSLGATRLMTIRSKSASAARDPRPRFGRRQSARHELRDAAALRSRRSEDAAAVGPRISVRSGFVRPMRRRSSRDESLWSVALDDGASRGRVEHLVGSEQLESVELRNPQRARSRADRRRRNRHDDDQSRQHARRYLSRRGHSRGLRMSMTGPPLTTFTFTCEIVPEGSGSTIAQHVEFSGPLGSLFAAMMGNEMAKHFSSPCSTVSRARPRPAGPRLPRRRSARGLRRCAGCADRPTS